MRYDKLLTQAIYSNTQILHCSKYTFAACTVKTKKNRKNIRKIKQLAQGSSKCIGTIVFLNNLLL